MAQKTSIFTDVDFEKSGKQSGFLHLPHSPHEDAWGVIPIPICVIKNGKGPTVILEGGNHGDEYEGPITLGELVRDLDPGEVEGRLIIIPAINLPAVAAGRRLSPEDGKNFNRCFPGLPTGTATEQIMSSSRWLTPSLTFIPAARRCRSCRARSSSRRPILRI
jgi:predicted deacylase